MKKELVFAMVVSAGLHAGLLFGFGKGPAPVMVVPLVSDDPSLADKPDPLKPDPVPQAEADDEPADYDPTALDYAFGLPELAAHAITADTLTQTYHARPPMPGRPDMQVGIPVDDGRSHGGRAVEIPMAGVLDRTPEPRHQVSPSYPPDLRRIKAEGTVQVLLVVDTRGRVVSAAIAHSDNPGFDSAALDAARRWTFEPGTLHGQLVPFRMILPLVFRVRE